MFKFLELCHILSIVITDQRSMIIGLFTAKQKFPSDPRTVTEYYSSQSLSPSSSHKNDVACEVKQKSFPSIHISRLVNEMDCMSMSPKRAQTPGSLRARSGYRAGQLSHSTLLEQHKISIRSWFPQTRLGGLGAEFLFFFFFFENVPFAEIFPLIHAILKADHHHHRKHHLMSLI